MKSLFTIFFISYCSLFSFYQDTTSTSDNNNLSSFSDTLRRDSICYKFKFLSGDTLIYKVKSRDSIIMGFDEALIKNRNERIRIICDSIDIEGRYNLSFELINFTSIENQGNSKTIKRETNAWINRKSFIKIDSLGVRYNVAIDDSTKASLSPGGAFQPFLFTQLKESCKIPNETWMNIYLMELAENGYPFPLVRMSYLYRAKELKDTLGVTFKNYEYINSGQGSIEINNKDAKVSITNIINAHSRVLLDKDFDRIVYQFTTQEQKLKIKGKSDEPMNGVHYTNAEFFLESYSTFKPKTNTEHIIKKKNKN